MLITKAIGLAIARLILGLPRANGAGIWGSLSTIPSPD